MPEPVGAALRRDSEDERCSTPRSIRPARADAPRHLRRRSRSFPIVALLALLLSASAFAQPAPTLAAQLAAYHDRTDDATRSALETLAAAHPDNAAIANALGKIARKTRRDDDALRHHERAVSLAPANAEYLIDLADIYGVKAQKTSLFTKLEFARKCGRTFKRASELDPQNLIARIALIEFCYRAPEMAGGGMTRAHEEARALRDINFPAGSAQLALLSLLESKPAEAFAFCDEALARAPDDYGALLMLGRVAATTGQQLDRAIAALEKCLQLPPSPGAPEHTSAWFHLGTIR